MEVDRKNPGPQSRDTRCARAAQSKRTWYKNHFVWKFKGKMPDPNPATHVAREPAQSKRTWTFHKSHFVWKFNSPDTDGNTSIKHRALTLTVRTPQCAQEPRSSACNSLRGRSHPYRRYHHFLIRACLLEVILAATRHWSESSQELCHSFPVWCCHADGAVFTEHLLHRRSCVSARNQK